MKRMSPEDYARKWAERLSRATDEIRRGVEGVTEAPGALAARKKDKWVAKMTSKAVQDKWAANVGSVPLDEWKRQIIEKGIPRISAGTEGARDKMRKFGEQLLSYQASLLPKVKAMPDITLDDMIRRMEVWVRGMANFKPSK